SDNKLSEVKSLVDVVFPIGFDSFGLPAENAAIDRRANPRSWTAENISAMKAQLKSMDISFDWHRELSTCEPEYYKWTQYLFLKLYEHGLVYRKHSSVNWDPIDETVLANEQVDNQGRAERSGALVEKRKLEQWYFKITEYQNELLQDLDSLNWPRRIKQLQANWIGKENGYQIFCQIDGESNQGLDVFFTNSEAGLFAEYVAISSEHPLIESKAIPERYKAQVQNLAAKIRNAPINQRGNSGCFTGLNCTNPLNSQLIPVYLSGNVDPEFASGATFGASQVDAKDADFVSVHSISKRKNEDNSVASEKKKFLERHKKTYVSNLNSFSQFKLRDWLISRQRYWGTPVPFIHCLSCGPVPVPESDLPVKLPENIVFSGRGGSPLASVKEWVDCKCPKCKSDAKRDTDTMDTFVDSSWYWLRHLDVKNQIQFSLNYFRICDPQIAAQNLPVTTYVGGIEHAILHLLYARFIGKFLFKSGIVPSLSSSWSGEPFQTLLAQGMVTGRTVKCKTSGRYLKPNEVDWTDANNPIIKESGEAAVVSHEKMSKSKYNGVDLLEVISKYGSDCTRLYIMYKAAPADELMWDEHGIVGMQRWMAKCRKLVDRVVAIESAEHFESLDIKRAQQITKETLFVLNTTIQEITIAITKTYGFHVAIASLIKLSNHLDSLPLESLPFTKPVIRESAEALVQMLSIFAPRISNELWATLGHAVSVHETSWPTVATDALNLETGVCVIMVDGKMRGTTEIPKTAMKSTSEVEKHVLKSEVGRKWLFNEVTGDKLVFKKVLVMKEGSVVNFLK
ncbi:hypothetical protein HK100_011037, partial [Physocladia obscura]